MRAYLLFNVMVILTTSIADDVSPLFLCQKLKQTKIIQNGLNLILYKDEKKRHSVDSNVLLVII